MKGRLIFIFISLVIIAVTGTSFTIRNNPVPVGSGIYSVTAADSFPTPKVTGNFLFYVQRSKNINTIMYEINTLANGDVDMNDPVKIYWIRYTSDGSTASLTYVQNKFAYGVTTEVLDKKNKSFKVNFVSYDKKTIYLMKSPADKKYHAYLNVDGKYLILYRVFVKIDGGSYWFPSISNVELKCIDPSTNKFVVQSFKP